MLAQLHHLFTSAIALLQPIVLILAWAVPLAVIIQYRASRVPARLREIKASLLRPPAEGSADKFRQPAVHYVRLFLSPDPKLKVANENDKPAEELTRRELEERIESQFSVFHGHALYVVATLAVALTSAMALAAIAQGPSELFKAWTGSIPPTTDELGARAIYALLGAYVWSLYEILTRQSSCDLTPDELFTVAVRYLVAIPLGFAVALLFELADPKIGNAIAFCLSAFPLNEVRRMIRRRTLKKLGEEAPAENPAREALLSETVDGLSLETLARLSELQITTYTDLAYADPLRIMLKTGYSLRHVLQWMDHALLAVYVPKHKRALRDAGLPCALDVKEFYEAHFADVTTEETERWSGLEFKSCEAVTELVNSVKLPASLLCEIFQRVASDPHVRFLDTLWYTGYLPKDTPRLPKCYSHKVVPKPA